MSDLVNILTSQLSGNALNALSGQLGTDSSTAGHAVKAALPMLLGALAKNSSNGDGAIALANALDKDHDGSVLDDVAGFLGNSQNLAIGGSILKHVLGSRQNDVASGLGTATGLNSNQSGQLLQVLAPLVLGALGKQKRSQGLDAGGLSDLLGTQRAQAEQSNPAFGMLGKLLDRDGDGSVVDDLGSMLGGFLDR